MFASQHHGHHGHARQNPITGTLKNYRVVKQLGEGAFSKVALAKFIPSNTDVALKKIDLSKLNETYYNLSINEVRLLKMVNSDNVVKCYEAFTEYPFMYVAVEYMDAHDMSYRIEALRKTGTIFSERSIWYYFHQICNGLKDMHFRRILHRDLKPANVFLNSAGVVKLGDLGLSRLFSAKTMHAKTRVGTEYYMAPERTSGSGYHFKSDIWSLGCLLYEMCTLRSPFNGETTNAYALHKRVSQGDFPPFPMGKYSRQLVFFTISCLSVNPDERPNADMCYQAARKMSGKFEEMLMQYNLSLKQQQPPTPTCTPKRTPTRMFRRQVMPASTAYSVQTRSKVKQGKD